MWNPPATAGLASNEPEKSDSRALIFQAIISFVYLRKEYGLGHVSFTGQ